MRNSYRGGRGSFRGKFNSNFDHRERRGDDRDGVRPRPTFKRSYDDRGDFRDTDRDKRFRRGGDDIIRSQDRRDNGRTFRLNLHDSPERERPAYRGDNFRSDRFNNHRNNETRRRSYSASPPRGPRRESIRGRLGGRGGRISTGTRIVRKFDPLRGGGRGGRGGGGDGSSRPITGATGSREYLKRMKEARKKLKKSDDEDHDDDDEEEENEMEEEPQHDAENNEDYLDLGNDEELLDDGEASTSKVKVPAKVKAAATAAGDDDEQEPKADEEKSDEDEPMASDQEKSFEKIDQQLENEIRKREKRSRKRKPIEWSCIHCHFESPVIKEYLHHLRKDNHMRMMRKVSQKAQFTLNNLRKYQRERQFEFETKVDNVEEIPSKYCKSCKLYFRQTKVEHIRTDDHRKILIFLRPFCKICDIRFLTPMKYEEHRCSVAHLKTKHRRAEFFKEEEDKDLDMSQMNFGDFKTVDSVGDVDGEDDDSDIDSQQEPVGQNFVSEKRVIYCDLCEEILTFDLVEGSQSFIDEHCKSRRHVRFHRLKEEEEKKKAAEEARGADGDDEAASTSHQQDNNNSGGGVDSKNDDDDDDDDGVGEDAEVEEDDE